MEGGHNQPSVPPVVNISPPAVPLSPEPAAAACDRISIDYDITTAIISAVCFVFGILYCFFGYRFFKATMFMTGFIFGSLITYLICLEEQLLPLEGKIGVSVTAGVLCGLITMLVQYVGVFMTGFHLGLLIGVGALCITEQFYHPTTKWICIGVLFGGGLLFALLSLKFRHSLTIFGTSIFGSAMIVAAIDYYIEMFMMVLYVWDRVKAEYSDPICWFSWIILGLWPATFLVGAFAQWKVTGRGFEHKDSSRAFQVKHPEEQSHEPAGHCHSRRGEPLAVEEAVQQAQAFIPVVQNKRQKFDIQRIHKLDDTPQHSRYRHLYQVRRGNGDVISQNPRIHAVVP